MLWNFLHVMFVLSKGNLYEKKFVDEYSLIYPHISPNGKSPHVEFKNDFLIKTKSRADYTQLGYKSNNSFGMLKFIKKLNMRDFSIDIDFSLVNAEKGGRNAGFGFWIDSEPDNASTFYGKKGKVKGFGIIIDMENQPIIKCVDVLGLKGTPLYINKNINHCMVSIEKKKYDFNVKVIINGKSHILYNGVSKLPLDSFFHITSFSGKSNGTININRIFFNKIYFKDGKVYVKGKRSSNFIIIVFGILSLGGLFYYLFSKKEKEFHLKN